MGSVRLRASLEILTLANSHQYQRIPDVSRNPQKATSTRKTLSNKIKRLKGGSPLNAPFAGTITGRLVPSVSIGTALPSFSPHGPDCSHKSPWPSSSSKAPSPAATTSSGLPVEKLCGPAVFGTPVVVLMSMQKRTPNTTLEKAITHLTAVVTQLMHRVTTIEQRILSGAFSHPPTMTETPTSNPMDTDLSASIATKRKAYEVRGTQPGDTPAQIEHLTSVYE
ncbi:hypothetical protein MRX96_000284 [Rhipicephalus microplus]